MHAALGDEHAVDGVHVGDDRVDGQRLVGRQAGVHRLEAEDAAEPLVVEVPRHDLGEPAEAAEADELERGRSGRARSSGRVEAALDERRHLQVVQPGEPVAEAAEGAPPPGRRTRRGSPRSWPRGRGGRGARCRRRSRPGTSGRRGAGSSRSRPSTPAASKHRSMRCGIVSTVGPVSKRKPSRSSVPARPPGPAAASSTVTSCPAAGQVAGGRQAAEAGADDDDRASCDAADGAGRRARQRGAGGLGEVVDGLGGQGVLGGEERLDRRQRTRSATTISRTRSAPASSRSGSPRRRSRTVAGPSSASRRARSTSSVRLPSRRSSRALFPVSAGSPKRPRMSSRSWKARPTASP